jgi:hypothetical protein
MGPPFHQPHRQLLRRLNRPSRPELARQRRVPPRIMLPISVHRACGVGHIPPARPAIHVARQLALGDGVATLREVQRALVAPVLGGDEAGDEGWAEERGAVLPPLKAVYGRGC